MSRSKFGNRKTVLYGITFDSREEAWRYPVLLERGERGEISDLRLQPVYEVQEGFTYRGKPVAPITYIADYDYLENGVRVVEDVKGHLTVEFRLKQKLFQHRYPHLELRIVKKATEERKAPTVFDLQHNYISDKKHDSYKNSSLWFLLGIARCYVNPWRIVRQDGVVIACSYVGFTSTEQATANGRAA